jgi:hypothetical protein
MEGWICEREVAGEGVELVSREGGFLYCEMGEVFGGWEKRMLRLTYELRVSPGCVMFHGTEQS